MEVVTECIQLTTQLRVQTTNIIEKREEVLRLEDTGSVLLRRRRARAKL